MREGAIKKSGRIFGFVLGFYALCFGISSSPFVFALNPLKAISQYGHDIWQMEDGLPQSYVNSIIQSRSGYLWLGTQGGVVRFDGVRFSPTKNGDALLLKASVVLVLLEDRQGNLWVGTDGKGLFRIKDANVVHFGEKEGFPFSSIWALCEDNSGNIWIGTDRGGLVRYHGDKFVAFTKKDGLLSNSIFAIYEDRDGSLWIGTDNGLNHYEHGILSSITRKDGLIGDFAYPVLRDKKGALWIGTDGGLNRLMDGKITSYTTKDGLLANSVWALQEDRDGNLWIGSKNGLNRFYDGKFSAYTIKDGLSNDAVWSLCEDREGNLWIGTRSGLNRFRDGRFTTFTSKEGLPGDVASSIFQSSDGSFWFGTDGGGLAHDVDGRFTVYNTENGLSDNSVFCVREGKNRDIWVGTNRGVNQFSNGKWTSFLKDSIVWTLTANDSNQLWIGTRDGLVRHDQDRFTTFSTNQGLTSNEIWDLLEEPDGALWIGTYNGLNYYKDGKFTPLNSFSKFPVTSLYKDDQGAIWIGTNGDGLIRYQQNKFARISTKDGLLDDFVFETLEDNLGNFWISSSKGIYVVKKNEVSEIAEGKKITLAPITFGIADGLKSRVGNDGSYSAWKAKDGKLWFSTMKGVTVVDPNTNKKNKLSPPVVIEQVTVNEHPVFNELQPLKFTEFPPGSEKFEFQYTGLSFIAPEEVQFKYKLEGFDQKWIDAAKRRTAYYTNVPPGNYVFRVTAENNDGVWSQEGAAFGFLVHPHFYQTRWFYTLGIMAVALAGFALSRLRVRQLRRREKDLVHLVEERTIELERTNEILRQISYLDAVTGTSNRRRFDEMLDLEWRKAYRNRSFFSLIMLDIDLFKPFNDAYGHQSGDNCLKQVAGAINSQLRRAGDFLARYGGEEFVIILPEADAESAVSVADRIRTTVQSLGIPHSTSTVKKVVTISLGVATVLVYQQGSPQQLIAAADSALYRAKNLGRNQVVSEMIVLDEHGIVREPLKKP